MSFPTKACFVHSGKGWDTELLKHPSMEYLNDFNVAFCETQAAHSDPYTKWTTQDWEFQAQNGQRLAGEDAWKRLIHTTRFFDSFSIDPLFVCMQKTAEGYEGMMYVNLYTNFVQAGEKKYTHSKGSKWELLVSISLQISAAIFADHDADPKGLLRRHGGGFKRTTWPETQQVTSCWGYTWHHGGSV
jgi:hypothetical protein